MVMDEIDTCINYCPHCFDCMQKVIPSLSSMAHFPVNVFNEITYSTDAQKTNAHDQNE